MDSFAKSFVNRLPKLLPTFGLDLDHCHESSNWNCCQNRQYAQLNSHRLDRLLARSVLLYTGRSLGPEYEKDFMDFLNDYG